MNRRCNFILCYKFLFVKNNLNINYKALWSKNKKIYNFKNYEIIWKNGRRSKGRRKPYMLTITLFCSKNHKRLKIWLMLRIYTINDVKKNLYVYKNENKHPRGWASSSLFIYDFNSFYKSFTKTNQKRQM